MLCASWFTPPCPTTLNCGGCDGAEGEVIAAGAAELPVGCAALMLRIAAAVVAARAAYCTPLLMLAKGSGSDVLLLKIPTAACAASTITFAVATALLF